MLSFPPAVRIWLALAPADLRKGFDALAELVRQHLRDDPLSGHVFVFRNRRSDRIKLLYWDCDGYVIVYKRLEAGTFRFPTAAEGQAGVTFNSITGRRRCLWSSISFTNTSAPVAAGGQSQPRNSQHTRPKSPSP
jgi:transposase